MASSAITVHQAAQQKQQNRRQAAIGSSVTQAGVYLAALDTAGMTLFPAIKDDKKKYDTVALAFLPDKTHGHFNRVIGAFKSIKDPPSARDVWAAVSAQMNGVNIQDVIVLYDHVSDTNVDEPAHLHSEMAIIQFVVNSLGISKNDLGRSGLEIACIGKGVCPDCSGWMAKHGIPHSKTRDTVASTGWTHPLSGAFFKYSGNDLQYHKAIKGIMSTEQAKGTAYVKG